MRSGARGASRRGKHLKQFCDRRIVEHCSDKFEQAVRRPTNHVEGLSPRIGAEKPRSGWRWHGSPPSATIHSPTRGSRFLPPKATCCKSARTQASLRPIAPGKVTASFAPLGRVLFWELFCALRSRQQPRCCDEAASYSHACLDDLAPSDRDGAGIAAENSAGPK